MASDATVLAQPRRERGSGPVRAETKIAGFCLFAYDGAAEHSPDWRAGRVQEWLLLLLRFAITRDPKDEAAALAMADEIDALGLRWRPSAPSFFRRTSAQVCWAIAAPDGPKRAAFSKATSRDRRSSVTARLSSCGRVEQGVPPPLSKAGGGIYGSGLRR